MTDTLFLHRKQVGIRKFEQGDLEGAETLFNELLSSNPLDAELWSLLGAVRHETERYEEAREAYLHALELDRRNPDYLHDLGVVLMKLDEPEEAVKKLRASLTVRPNSTRTLMELGRAFRKMGDMPQAEGVFKRVLQRDRLITEAYIELAGVYKTRCRTEEVERCYRDGLACQPASGDLHIGLALFLLDHAKFEEAWKEYQWRFVRWEAVTKAGLQFWTWQQSPWSGRLESKRIELFAEQGLGDALFFLRFAEQARQLGARTVLYLPTKLLQIVKRTGCVNEVHDMAVEPRLTRDSVLIGDLPFLVGMKSMKDIPPPVHLSPLAVKVEEMRRRLQACGPAPYIGLTWRAGAVDGRNKYLLAKNIPLDALAAPIANLPGTLLALQRNPRVGEFGRLAEHVGRVVHDFSDVNEDIEDALAMMACLDDYIGVSNTNVHLLAGVGGKAHILVPTPYEWRWMVQGDESPWFKGFPVYRQSADGSWREAISRLHAELQSSYLSKR